MFVVQKRALGNAFEFLNGRGTVVRVTVNLTTQTFLENPVKTTILTMVNIWLDALVGKWSVPKDSRPSFAGRTIIVTGANVGLGFEAALKWVELGAKKVILAVRTLSKGDEAKRQIESRTGRTGVLEVWHLDMLDYASIKAFADRANRDLDRIDVACLNAGVVMQSFKESPYGYEQTMQVNVLSTALLALLLVPKLRASKTGTYTPVLEIVGSSMHYTVTKLKSESAPFAAYNKPDRYSGQDQYAVSKLFVMYLQSALLPLANNKETSRPDFHVTVVCPGACESDLARDISAWYFRILLVLFRLLIQRRTEEGARTYISGVDQGERLHGRFWRDDQVRE